MTVVLRHSQELELNHVAYQGSVSLAELAALAEFQAANPTWLTYDTLSWITAGADFDTVDLSALDSVFERYRQLFQPRQLLIFRRSAWICDSPRAQPHLDHWIGGRDTRAGISSDIRQFETFAQAGAWLVLSESESAALANGDGFNEIVLYTIPPRAFAR